MLECVTNYGASVARESICLNSSCDCSCHLTKAQTIISRALSVSKYYLLLRTLPKKEACTWEMCSVNSALQLSSPAPDMSLGVCFTHCCYSIQ